MILLLILTVVMSIREKKLDRAAGIVRKNELVRHVFWIPAVFFGLFSVTAALDVVKDITSLFMLIACLIWAAYFAYMAFCPRKYKNISLLGKIIFPKWVLLVIAIVMTVLAAILTSNVK